MLHLSYKEKQRIMSATISVTATWEDLRKRARQLENDIDRRLLSLNKLGHNLGGERRFDVYASSSSSEKEPLVNAQSQFDDISCELDRLITELTDINDQMHSLLQQSTTLNSGAAPQHMLKRHRDILRDYHYEFNRTRDNIRRALNRQELLGHDTADGLSSANDGLNNRRSDPLLKENEHIRSSDRLLDEQISIAISTKEYLSNQKIGLRDISKKINTITKRYPALNSLMHKIQFKKRKDTVVIAVVVSVCLFLMLLYIWRT